MTNIVVCSDLSLNPITGELQTPATWIRDFVRSHPSYKFDSVVSQEINYDLLKAVDAMYVYLYNEKKNADLVIVSMALVENRVSYRATIQAVPMTKGPSDCKILLFRLFQNWLFV